MQDKSGGQALPARHFVFAYGSLINTKSRVGTIGGCGVCAVVRVSPQQAISRAWNFRSQTGFTALGIREDQAGGKWTEGVCFGVDDLPVVDDREQGYKRVRIPLHHLHPSPHAPHPSGLAPCACSPPCAAGQQLQALLRTIQDAGKNQQERVPGDELECVWMYVPLPEFALAANKDYPICQTYLDTVLVGCLELGGESMASDFVAATTGWSHFFLNDSPLSRRPWLHRPRYRAIDRILADHASLTLFDSRRHPEEFALEFLGNAWRGLWNVPNRNPMFVGRDSKLQELEARLCGTAGASQPATPTQPVGVLVLETVGLGGVGKTQVAIEYCYRHYQRRYGLIAWINGESPESIAADFQSLALSAGVAVKDRPSTEVVEEVKGRLRGSKCPWLLVFDNVENPSLVSSYIPNGGGDTTHARHVIITTRLLSKHWNSQRMVLDCWGEEESLQYLRFAAGEHSQLDTEEGLRACKCLASELGHLPLALSVAAAYMRRCDMGCTEYLARFASSKKKLLSQEGGDAQRSVIGSLSLSLDRVAKESTQASTILNCLCFLASDGISRPLIHTLLKCILKSPNGGTAGAVKTRKRPVTALGAVLARLPNLGVRRSDVRAAAWVLCAIAWWEFAKRRVMPHPVGRLHKLVLVVSSALALLVSARSWPRALSRRTGARKRVSTDPNTHATPALPSEGDLEVMSDSAWDILKTLSILVVRHEPFFGAASIHRLLQQLIRDAMGDAERSSAVCFCVRALKELWKFDVVDQSTWGQSAYLLEHVRSLVRHAMARQDLDEHSIATLASLLTKGAVHISVVWSDFEDAQRMLEQAVALHGRVPGWLVGHSDTMLELGKVLRYRGKMQESQQHLQAALTAYRKSYGDHHLSVATTLHELGALAVKRGDVEEAERHLRQSLELKRSLFASSASDHAGESDRITREEAATLHQLAIVAMACKPPRLDEAEKLLKSSLHTAGLREGHAGLSSCRAATLQQLARVAIRRGQLELAEKYLHEALALYDKVYGSRDHINKASVWQLLGAVAKGRGNWNEAIRSLREALKIRKRVYGAEQNLEVAYGLHELGKALFANHQLDEARACLDEGAEQLQLVLQAERRVSWGSLDPRDWERKKERAERELIFCLHTLRSIAKAQGNAAAATSFKARAKSLRKQQATRQQTNKAQCRRRKGSSVRTPEVVQTLRAHPSTKALLTTRAQTRRFAVTAARAKGAVDTAPITQALSDLSSLLSGWQLQQDDELRQELAVIKQTSLHFCTDVGEALQADELCTNALFEACDRARARLRGVGVVVEDTSKDQ